MTEIRKPLLLAAFVALQILDVVTTLRFLDSGRGVEANPVMALAMLHLGAWWWIAKLAAALLTLPILARGRIRYVAVMVAFYTVTVANNVLL
jgi:hypothetical protein